MPEFADQLWATPGLIWLTLTISVAGVMRGFTGFGTALIFVPVAGIFLPPEQVVALITLTGVASTGALLPRAWRQAHRREAGVMALAALLTVPLGLWLMESLDRVTVRWLVVLIAGGTLIALVAGWRYTGRIRLPGILAVGGAAGAIGGMTGLTGPAVILFYLAGQNTAQYVRANTILFLAILDVVIIANLLFKRAVGFDIFVLAAFVSVPYFITTLLGQSLFDPRHDRLYRWAAYGVIALALVTGLPVWT